VAIGEAVESMIRPSLVEKDADQVGKELGGFPVPGDLRTDPGGEVPGSAGFAPDSDQSSQAPEIDQKNFSILGASDRRDQELLDDIELPADDSAQSDPGKKRGDDLLGGKAKYQGEERRHQGPESEIPGGFIHSDQVGGLADPENR